jgi:biopolymer transport protein ExbD
MPIRYRCDKCNQLISIATRMAGKVVPCPTCKEEKRVPQPEPPKPEEDDEEEFGPKKRHCEFGELDLTPMVDVTMLLLIFFILTASFIAQKTLQTPQQKSDSKGGASSAMDQDPDDLDDGSIVVQINERNGYIVDEVPVAPPQLMAKLKERRSRDRSDLMIDGHPDCSWESVIVLIDTANEIGIQKIRMKAREDAD